MHSYRSIILIENRLKEDSIIKKAREFNIKKELYVSNKIIEIIKRSNKHNKYYIYGLTYKPDVGDFRESPALRIVQSLSNLNIKQTIIAIDPFLEKEYKKDNIFYKKDFNIENNTLLFILVKHSNLLDKIINNKYKLNFEIKDLTTS